MPTNSLASRTLCLLVLLIALALLFESKASAQGRGVEIKGMQAKLFLNRENSFGEDLLAAGETNIVWNVGVNVRSNATLVIVELGGEPFTREPARRLNFTASIGRRVLINQTVPVYNLDDGKFYGAFMVHHAGCSPVKVTARILGQRNPSTMTKIINFQCGE